MLDTPLAPWPSYSEEEVDAVAAVMRSNRVNYWTGQECRIFEREFAEWAGTSHAIALSNGTLALDLALQGLGIGPGDEVIVTPRSFIASVSSVINAGATPVFADVDIDSGNISPATIAPVINDRTRAILPVHIAGWPCDMNAIMEMAVSQKIAVIEDCAQAHGAQISGRSVGSFGHVNAWSFCQDKIMTTGGEGGMVTTSDAEVWSRMWSHKDHGKSWNAVYERQHPPGFRWLHESFGTNWRMIEMQAAIGRIQLARMEAWTDARTHNALKIAATLNSFPGSIRMPLPPDGMTHAFYRLYGYVKPDGLKNGWNRDRVIAGILQRGGTAFQGTCSEIYLEKAFEGSGFTPSERLPVARELGETSLMFLTHPNISDEQISVICDAVTATLIEASC